MVNKLDRPWTLLTTPSTCPGETFQVKYKIWDRVAERNTLIFGDTRISLQHSGRKLPCQKQLDPFSRFDTYRLVTDRQTDRLTTTAYTALAYRVARWRGFCDYWSLHENITSSTKPEVHDVLQCGHSSIPSNGDGHCKKVMGILKIWFWYRGLCLQQTYRLRDRDIIQTCYSIVFWQRRC